MKKIGTKQIVPLVLAVFAVVFAVVGFTQLGFWEDVDGPKPGFFPAIMAIVMFLASIASFFQYLTEEKAERDADMKKWSRLQEKYDLVIQYYRQYYQLDLEQIAKQCQKLTVK